MQGRCCCGCCSLSTATSVILIFCSIEAACALFCNIELLLILTNGHILNPFSLLINVDYIEDFDIVHGLILAAIGLNIIWILSAIFAARGNVTLRTGRLTPWVMIAYLITLFDLGAAIYFAVKFQDSLSTTRHLFVDHIPTKPTTYLTFLCLFSGGGIWLIIKIYFAHVVQLRGKEIDHDYSTLAFYILSHINRCSSREGLAPLLPEREAPPSYCPNGVSYLPANEVGCTRNSSRSSWSLSYDALRTMCEAEPVAVIDSKTGQKIVCPSVNMTGVVRRDDLPSYNNIVNMSVNYSSAQRY
ncbi:uncharacterized protein LOC129219243 [Uloborus diversus]|uniref:uncharacterized protein LOC129219243 n=1 Tax=Uloborus diversus TaxID=327109 RepID=UPI00240A521D|nr:uncharacterized protein LOC129219243 [Uloborus diversus]